MRQNKEPTVIFTQKAIAEEMVYHCKYHSGCRSVRLPDGSRRCQICGSPEVAIRMVMTYEQKETYEETPSYQRLKLMTEPVSALLKDCAIRRDTN